MCHPRTVITPCHRGPNTYGGGGIAQLLASLSSGPSRFATCSICLLQKGEIQSLCYWLIPTSADDWLNKKKQHAAYVKRIVKKKTWGGAEDYLRSKLLFIAFPKYTRCLLLIVGKTLRKCFDFDYWNYRYCVGNEYRPWPGAVDSFTRKTLDC